MQDVWLTNGVKSGLLEGLGEKDSTNMAMILEKPS